MREKRGGREERGGLCRISLLGHGSEEMDDYICPNIHVDLVCQYAVQEETSIHERR